MQLTAAPAVCGRGQALTLQLQEDDLLKAKLPAKTQKRESAGPHIEKTQPVITVDYERYKHFLDHTDLTEDQRREFCQALWSIIVEFVSLGFGVHPLQQAQNACGKLPNNPSKPALMAPDPLYLDHQLIAEASKAFKDAKQHLGEGVE